MMIIRKEINFNDPLSKEQVEMLKSLESRPIQFDEDCPEYTEAQQNGLFTVKDFDRNSYVKQPVMVELSPQAIQKAKSLGNGKGYTSILSRILETALGDNDLIKSCL